jgi:hypothetical protein
LSSWVLATLGTLGFFGGIALLVGWVFLTMSINNVYVALTVFIAPFVVAVFTLAYFVAESL